MKKRFKNKIVSVIGVILLLFGLYNLIWYIIVSDKYNDFIVDMEEIYPNRTYVINNKDGYTYNVKIPDYLSFTGNLGVHPYEGGDCGLIIWPGIFEETTYGVFITSDDGRTHAVMLTEERMPLGDAPEQTKQLVEENKDKIDALFDRACEMWKF